MNKYKNITDSEYRSQLERYAARRLKEENIEFCYECWQVPLLEAVKVAPVSYEKSGKKFKEITSIRAMTYNPDFIGFNWIIETKGKRLPDFVIKWKLFKKYLFDNQKKYTLFMPTNQKEVEQCIEIIKTL